MKLFLTMLWVNCIIPMNGFYIFYVPDYLQVSYIEIGFVKIDRIQEKCTLFTHEGDIITTTTIQEDNQSLTSDSLQMSFSTVSDSIIQMDIMTLPEGRPIYYHRLSQPQIVKPQPTIPSHIHIKVVDGYYFLETLNHNNISTLYPITAIKENSLEYWDLPKREVISISF